MKTKSLAWMTVFVVAVIVGGGYVWLMRDDAKPRQAEQRQQVKKKVGGKRTAKVKRTDREKPKSRRMDSVAAAEKALKSTNPDVRRDAVDALGWFGEEALAELTVWMADADEDVAQAAMGHWEDAVSELEDANERLQTSLFALNTLTDKDALTMIGSQFANAATELIDEEEDEALASQKRTEVIQALVDMIEGGKPAHVEAASEIYEDVTGNKWISVDEAEKYLRDPDNYEEPDSE